MQTYYSWVCKGMKLLSFVNSFYITFFWPDSNVYWGWEASVWPRPFSWSPAGCSAPPTSSWRRCECPRSSGWTWVCACPWTLWAAPWCRAQSCTPPGSYPAGTWCAAVPRLADVLWHLVALTEAHGHGLVHSHGCCSLMAATTALSSELPWILRLSKYLNQ